MKHKIPYIILTPGIILLLFFLIIPLIRSIWPTFFLSDAFTVSNYVKFLGDSYNRSILFRTVRIAVIVTVVCIVLGIPTAYFIAGISNKWKGLLMGVTLFPLLTNSVIRSFAWINILGKNGVVNTLLLNLHLVHAPVNLLYTEFSIIVGSVYLFLPTMILTLVGVMETIEDEMLEAAQTLGASPMMAFLKIVLPLSIPGSIVGSTLVFTGTLTAYTTPQLLGGNQKMMLSTFLYQKASTLGDWQSAGMIALIMIVITLLVMAVLNGIAKRLDSREVGNA
jgi:putative spermidine/putrescine transport system permease protein